MAPVARTVRGRVVVITVLLLLALGVAHDRAAVPAEAEPVVSDPRCGVRAGPCSRSTSQGCSY